MTNDEIIKELTRDRRQLEIDFDKSCLYNPQNTEYIQSQIDWHLLIIDELKNGKTIQDLLEKYSDDNFRWYEYLEDRDNFDPRELLEELLK